jgi:hypothetical protein
MRGRANHLPLQHGDKKTDNVMALTTARAGWRRRTARAWQVASHCFTVLQKLNFRGTQFTKATGMTDENFSYFYQK